MNDKGNSLIDRQAVQLLLKNWNKRIVSYRFRNDVPYIICLYSKDNRETAMTKRLYFGPLALVTLRVLVCGEKIGTSSLLTGSRNSAREGGGVVDYYIVKQIYFSLGQKTNAL